MKAQKTGVILHHTCTSSSCHRWNAPGLAKQTNLYSVQKEVKSINTSAKEIKQVLVMYMHMGLVQMLCQSLLGEGNQAFCSLWRNVFLFLKLQTLIHFQDNLGPLSSPLLSKSIQHHPVKDQAASCLLMWERMALIIFQQRCKHCSGYHCSHIYCQNKQGKKLFRCLSQFERNGCQKVLWEKQLRKKISEVFYSF